VRDLAEYGQILNVLDEYGIRYTFSTDAPSLQGTSLAAELLMLLNAKAATREQILRALYVADRASFLPRSTEYETALQDTGIKPRPAPDTFASALP
jgi:hypothetical protein